MVETILRISVGEIQRGTTEQLSGNQRAVLLYLAVFIPLTAFGSFLDLATGSGGTGEDFGIGFYNGIFGLPVMLVSVAAQYFLFEQMVFGARQDRPNTAARVLGFIGLAIVSFVGVMFATVLLIIPGIIVGARWLMCPAFYVGEDKRVFEALGASWNATRGNTVSAALAVFVVLLIAIMLGALLGAIVGFGSAASFLNPLVEAVINEAATVVLVAMSVTVYKLLSGRSADLAHTFS